MIICQVIYVISQKMFGPGVMSYLETSTINAYEAFVCSTYVSQRMAAPCGLVCYDLHVQH